MNNPWLSIPASDYEGHMSLPQVDQLSFLGNVFKRTLAEYDSSSVLYLGCATGNGLEYISNEKTHKLTAIDINPEYLEIVRNRYQVILPDLETIEADLNDYQGNDQQYALIFAGLIFEYLSPERLLGNISNWLEKEGIVVVVLQLQDKYKMNVSETPYSSLTLLEPIMNLISGQEIKQMAKESGLTELKGESVTLDSGKTFYIGVYAKVA